MNGKAIEILKEYNQLVDEINEAEIKVRINNSPFRKATETDKINLLREEWFKTTEKLSELGIEIEEY